MTAASRWAQSVRRGEFVSKFLPQSQLIVVVLQLGRLHKTADLGPSIQIRLLLGRIFRLLLNLVELGVVARKLLQCNEEITQVKPELVILRVERE